MKTFKIWIFSSIYLYVLNIYYTNGMEIDVPTPENQVYSSTLEPLIKFPESEEKTEIYAENQLTKDLNRGEFENRILKRRRKGKKNKKKKSKRNRKRKTTYKKNKVNKKNARASYDLTPDDLSDSEIPILEDENLNSLDLETDLYDNTVDPSLTEDVGDIDQLDSSTELLDPLSDIDPLDDLSSTSSLDTSDLAESSKKYWDADLVEPEYIISEWFAILDGKKFNKRSGVKFPYISDCENDYSNTYLSNKKQNSRYLMNKYSSGSRYGTDDDDNADHIKLINVSLEDLSRTFPDTREDEVENIILSQRTRPNRRLTNHNLGYRRVNSRRRNGNRKKRKTGIYDVQKAFATDVPVETGTYRKFDEDEIERYGLIKNQPDPVPVDDTDNGNIGAADVELMDSDDSVGTSGYDVSDLDLGDSVYPNEPADNPADFTTPILDAKPNTPTERLEKVPHSSRINDSPEYVGFGQILSNDYDDFEYGDKHGRRYYKKYKSGNKKCKKELKKLRKKYNKIIKRLREQASE